MTKKNFPPTSAFLQRRLARDHHLGLPLSTGILAVLAMAALFALIAFEVSSGGALTRLDQRLADWFNAHAQAFLPLTTLVLGYTHLHGTIGVLVMGALLLWHLLRQQRRAWALNVVLVLPGGMLFNFALKFVFARLRPQFSDPILVLHSYSFPSGHTIGATLLYAVAAAYLVNQPGIMASLAARLRWSAQATAVGVIALSALLVALTAFSRVYLGAHFLSDVLGAILLGTAWFALWTTVVFTLERHYCQRSRSN